MNKPTRRKFLAGASLLTLGATTSAWTSTTAPLIHHVFFWLKNPASKEDLDKLIEGVRTLSKIETVRDFRIGKPAQTPKRDVIDNSYAISLFTTFNNVADHNIYQEHAVHKKFIENYSHLWQRVQVYDSLDI